MKRCFVRKGCAINLFNQALQCGAFFMRPDMDVISAELAAEIAEREIADAAHRQASRVIAAIRLVPAYAVCPELVAQIAAALGAMCTHLPPEAREIAQGYFDDCHDDMRGFA
jgi:hypothetical protein